MDDDTLRFTPVGPGRLAAIATTLALRAAPPPRPAPPMPADEAIVDPGRMAAADYLALYRHVGADHLWFSRLHMPAAALDALLADPRTAIRIYRRAGVDEGLLEMRVDPGGECVIQYFGVTPPLQGTGAARRLMTQAIAIAFDAGATSLSLHTNTLDHPRALAFYRRSGFVPVAQHVEIAPDPRLTGHLPRDAAPHVPTFE